MVMSSSSGPRAGAAEDKHIMPGLANEAKAASASAHPVPDGANTTKNRRAPIKQQKSELWNPKDDVGDDDDDVVGDTNINMNTASYIPEYSDAGEETVQERPE